MRVHIPTGQQGAFAPSMQQSLDGIHNKVIGLIDNTMPNGNAMFDDIERNLTDTYKIAGVIKHRKQPGGETPDAVIDRFARECDAVIVGMANSGAPTSWTVRDSVRVAAAGLPVVMLGTDEFRELAYTIASAMGHGNLPMVTVKHPFTQEAREEVRAIAGPITGRLVNALLEGKPESAPVNQATGDRFMDVSDDVSEFNRIFFEKGWSDGLPLVPPTPERVQQMLRHTRRLPDEEIGFIPPFGTATVETVAIIGVMAGCHPEYMPILLAATEAIVDKRFELFFLQNTIHPTTTWLLVNGPIAKRLKINGGTNCLGPGSWANSTIGRALRLMTLVVGGGLPGEIDMATQGQPGKFLMCCAENEADSPWEPFHVEHGFDTDTSTVTLIAAKPPVSFTTHTQDVDDFLIVISNAMTGVNGSEYRSGGSPVILLSPEHARLIASKGLSKADFKRRVWERARLPVSKMGKVDRSRAQIDRRDEFGEFTEDTLLTAAKSPEDIIVLVAGGWGMLSSYIPCHAPISWPVTRLIDDWVPE